MLYSILTCIDIIMSPVNKRHVISKELREQRREHALRLRSHGQTYRQIAAVISADPMYGQSRYNHMRAKEDCEAALENITIENTASLHRMRSLELNRYDIYLERLQPQVDVGDTEAIGCALRISSQRAKLLGLYAPVEVKVQQIVRDRLEEEFNYFFEEIFDNELIPEHIKEMMTSAAERLVEIPRSAEFAHYN